MKTSNKDFLKLYEGRFSRSYKSELNTYLNKFIIYDKSEKQISSLQLDKLTLSLEKKGTKNYKKNIKNDGVPLSNCLRIDFSGISASTLLNTMTNSGVTNNKLNNRIEDTFIKLISEANCNALNRHGIYLKIRFLFSYLYSEMPFSLMKAENEENRRTIKGNRLLDYSFEIEPGLTEEDIHRSMIAKSHFDSLSKITQIRNRNQHLESALHNKAKNTFQVRFTPIPNQPCMMILNSFSYIDPYIYARKEEHPSPLSYQIPMIKIDMKKSKSYFDNVDNHFDYLWHHYLTLIENDAVNFDAIAKANTRPEQLNAIYLPYHLKLEKKKAIILDYLEKQKYPAYSTSRKIKDWESNFRQRILKSTKYPYALTNERPRGIDSATVLFADIVKFTTLTDESDGGFGPILEKLNHCFREFDSIVRKHGLEKIKTIGDGYLCVSGLDVSSEKDAENAILVGIEMIDFIQAEKKRGKIKFDIRIGIHTGPIIVGTLGTDKLQTDIFGSTVNIASRIEGESEPGRVNISKDTYKKVVNNNLFEFDSKTRTRILKGLENERMKMYLVRGIKKK